MPWRETGPVEERFGFVSAYEAGNASMTTLCERFGVSRKTGYKWLSRYWAGGMAGLEERPRVAQRFPHKTSAEMESRLLAIKREKPHWGPKKLLVLLRRRHPGLQVPAVSTAGDILKRHGLVIPCPQRRRRELRRATPLVEATAVNECWSADHKGEFLLGDGSECYPLTLTDNFSRYLLKCTALTGINTRPARRVFEMAFEEYGLPLRIRTDNGSPFGANRGLAISSLSLWWMRLGIRHERIQAGCPQQNGRHERMHRTLKAETALKPRFHKRAQQQRFDCFQQEYNDERPHEALDMNTPGSLYTPSLRPMPRYLPPLSYPAAFERRRIGSNGRFSYERTTYFISKVLQDEEIGLELLDEDRRRLWAGRLPLGVLDLRLFRFRAYDEDEQLEAA